MNVSLLLCLKINYRWIKSISAFSDSLTKSPVDEQYCGTNGKKKCRPVISNENLFDCQHKLLSRDKVSVMLACQMII